VVVYGWKAHAGSVAVKAHAGSVAVGAGLASAPTIFPALGCAAQGSFRKPNDASSSGIEASGGAVAVSHAVVFCKRTAKVPLLAGRRRHRLQTTGRFPLKIFLCKPPAGECKRCRLYYRERGAFRMPTAVYRTRRRRSGLSRRLFRSAVLVVFRARHIAAISPIAAPWA
jgi:hypothetical protein